MHYTWMVWAKIFQPKKTSPGHQILWAQPTIQPSMPYTKLPELQEVPSPRALKYGNTKVVGLK